MRYTHKLDKPDGNCNYFLIPDQEQCDNAENKLGQLEDIEEEMGFERSGSSLLAFLQSPYIKSIMRLYVSARKHLEEECKVPDVYENSSDLYDAIHIPADKELVEKYKEYYGFDTTAEGSQATYSHIVDLEKDYGK